MAGKVLNKRDQNFWGEQVCSQTAIPRSEAVQSEARHTDLR